MPLAWNALLRSNRLFCSYLKERKMPGGIHAINWEFFYHSYLQGAPFLPAWLTQSRSIEDLFKNQTCLQCQITAGFIYFHGLPTVICIKDNCGFLLKRILKFSGSFIWRWENRRQRSEKALWSWQRNGGYGMHSVDMTFTTLVPIPQFLLTKWALPLWLHSCLFRPHMKIRGNKLVTLQKTLADSLPSVSMNFEKEPSQTLKQGPLFYETSREIVPHISKCKEAPNSHSLSWVVLQDCAFRKGLKHT